MLSKWGPTIPTYTYIEEWYESKQGQICFDGQHLRNLLVQHRPRNDSIVVTVRRDDAAGCEVMEFRNFTFQDICEMIFRLVESISICKLRIHCPAKTNSTAVVVVGYNDRYSEFRSAFSPGLENISTKLSLACTNQQSTSGKIGGTLGESWDSFSYTWRLIAQPNLLPLQRSCCRSEHAELALDQPVFYTYCYSPRDSGLVEDGGEVANPSSTHTRVAQPNARELEEDTNARARIATSADALPGAYRR